MSLEKMSDKEIVDAIHADAKVGTPYDEREWGEYPVELIEEALRRLSEASGALDELAERAVINTHLSQPYAYVESFDPEGHPLAYAQIAKRKQR